MSETESKTPAPTNMPESTDHNVTAESMFNPSTPENAIPASMTQEHPGPVQPDIPPLPETMKDLTSTPATTPETSEALVVIPGARPQEHTAAPESSAPQLLRSPARHQSKAARKHPTPRNAVVDVPAGDIEVMEVMPPAHPGELSSMDMDYRKVREAIVSTGFKAGFEAAKALHEIYSYCGGALWKSEYQSFEMYCRTKWNYQKSQAYRLVEAGEFITELEISHSPRGENLPVNEGQVRPLLANVPRELRVECWQEIVTGKIPGELTSTIVAAGVRKFLVGKGIETKREKPAKGTEKSAIAVKFSSILRDVEQFLTLATLACRACQPAASACW